MGWSTYFLLFVMVAAFALGYALNGYKHKAVLARMDAEAHQIALDSANERARLVEENEDFEKRLLAEHESHAATAKRQFDENRLLAGKLAVSLRMRQCKTGKGPVPAASRDPKGDPGLPASDSLISDPIEKFHGEILTLARIADEVDNIASLCVAFVKGEHANYAKALAKRNG